MRRGKLSRRWRGMTVTSSISQRKATSAGVRPCGSGEAIALGGGGAWWLRFVHGDYLPGKMVFDPYLRTLILKICKIWLEVTLVWHSVRGPLDVRVTRVSCIHAVIHGD